MLIKKKIVRYALIALFLFLVGIIMAYSVSFPNQGLNPYYNALTQWLNVSHNYDGTLKKGLNVSLEEVNTSTILVTNITATGHINSTNGSFTAITITFLNVQYINGTDVANFNKSIMLGSYQQLADFIANYSKEYNATGYKLQNLSDDLSNAKVATIKTTTGTFDFVIVNKELLVFGNISNVNLTNININASVLPSLDNLFDLGNGTFRWRNANLSGTFESNSITAATARITNLQDLDSSNFFDTDCTSSQTNTVIDSTGARTCVAISITESQISDFGSYEWRATAFNYVNNLSFNKTLINQYNESWARSIVSNNTPFSSIQNMPAFSNMQMENISNKTGCANIIGGSDADFCADATGGGSGVFVNYTDENVSIQLSRNISNGNILAPQHNFSIALLNQSIYGNIINAYFRDIRTRFGIGNISTTSNFTHWLNVNDEFNISEDHVNTSLPIRINGNLVNYTITNLDQQARSAVGNCSLSNSCPSVVYSVNLSTVTRTDDAYDDGNLTTKYPNLDTDSTNDVTSVTGVSPITSSGGATPAISINADGIVNDTELQNNRTAIEANQFKIDPNFTAQVPACGAGDFIRSSDGNTLVCATPTGGSTNLLNSTSTLIYFNNSENMNFSFGNRNDSWVNVTSEGDIKARRDLFARTLNLVTKIADTLIDFTSVTLADFTNDVPFMKSGDLDMRNFSNKSSVNKVENDTIFASATLLFINISAVSNDTLKRADNQTSGAWNYTISDTRINIFQKFQNWVYAFGFANSSKNISTSSTSLGVYGDLYLNGTLNGTGDINLNDKINMSGAGGNVWFSNILRVGSQIFQNGVQVQTQESAFNFVNNLSYNSTLVNKDNLASNITNVKNDAMNFATNLSPILDNATINRSISLDNYFKPVQNTSANLKIAGLNVTGGVGTFNLTVGNFTIYTNGSHLIFN